MLPSSWFRLIPLLFLGFSSGLPLALTGSTLQAWFAVSNIGIFTIGLLSLAGQPYVYKFFWAPLFDRYSLPFLDKRRGWMLVTQSGLLLSIGVMAFLNPKTQTLLVSVLALFIAFLSASQDVVVDAYRTDILPPDERGTGSAMHITGYRLAMLVSGGLALILADHVGWQVTYLIMAALMSIGMLASWFAPAIPANYQSPTKLVSALIDPLREFLSRDYALLILLFILVYKLGDQAILTLTNVFLINGLGFSLTDVGVINKGVGLIAVLIGAFLGGSLMPILGLYRSLLYFGILQVFSNFTFVLLALAGKNYFLMAATVFIENTVSGMSTVAFLAFLMGLCDHRYSATQYALFSAVYAMVRVFIGPFAALLVEQLGWINFFFWTVILALPGLFLIWLLHQQSADSFEQQQI